jgi:Mycothiol maleylpyruvate isomerase N-terminal domain
MGRADEDVRAALLRQWDLIADAVPRIDLSASSRILGWRNREVLAHLYAQPSLLVRFLESVSGAEPAVRATENLAGTQAYKDLIDASAREGARRNKFDLRVPVRRARASVLHANMDATIETLQGSISVTDYLITRCVEAVVHGGDLVDPVAPDSIAQDIVSKALLDLLATTAPDLAVEARALPVAEWIDVATGRAVASGPLTAAMPIMT